MWALTGFLGLWGCAKGTGAYEIGGKLETGADAPQPSELVITEIMANPARCSDEVGEWLEVHNASSRSLPLGGLLVGRVDDPYLVGSVSSDRWLEPGGYATVARGTSSGWCGASGFAPDGFMGEGPYFRNDGEQLFISYPAVGLIDLTGLVPSAPSGASIQVLQPDAVANDEDYSWAVTSCQIAEDVDRATPGRAADDCSGSDVTDVGGTFNGRVSLESDLYLADYQDGTGDCTLTTTGQLEIVGDFGEDEIGNALDFRVELEVEGGIVALQRLWYHPAGSDDGCTFQPSTPIALQGEASDQEVWGAATIRGQDMDCSWVDSSPADDWEDAGSFDVDFRFSCGHYE